jgi:hypothetical protein
MATKAEIQALIDEIVTGGNYRAEQMRPLLTAMLDYSKPYKVYTALLTQTETDAPVATVLENTLGETGFSYSYNSVGSFFMIFPAATYLGSKLVIFNNTLNTYQGPVTVYHVYTGDYVESLLIETPGGGPSSGNSCLLNFAIEIRVYD